MTDSDKDKPRDTRADKDRDKGGRFVPDAGAETGDERVMTIVDAMADGSWCNAMARQLASDWGISRSRVSVLTSEARRVLRLVTDESREDVKARILARIDHVVAGAMSNVKRYRNKHGQTIEQQSPDYKAAIQGLKLQAELTGNLTKQLQVTAGSFDDMSDEQLAAYIAEHAPKQLEAKPLELSSVEVDLAEKDNV